MPDKVAQRRGSSIVPEVHRGDRLTVQNRQRVRIVLARIVRGNILAATGVPESVQDVGGVRNIHRVGSIRQTAEGVVPRAIGHRRRQDVSVAVFQRHRHPRIDSRFTTQNAIRILIVPDRAADRVRSAGVVAEVLQQIDPAGRQYHRRLVVPGIRRATDARVIRVDQAHPTAG